MNFVKSIFKTRLPNIYVNMLETITNFSVPECPIKTEGTELAIFIANRTGSIRIFIGIGVKDIFSTERESHSGPSGESSFQVENNLSSVFSSAFHIWIL